jgi:response regulator RpfG family c-di-GMP phosphodiesterase
MSVRWSGLKTDFTPGEILVLPRLETSNKYSKLRILVADDDPLIPEMLSERLRLQYSPEEADIQTTNSGEEALKILFDEPIDLLLTDYDFSRSGTTDAMNGLALLREIEAHRIVVTTIFMTGFGDEEVAKNAILQGAADYLTKPILKGLDEVVERCAQQHRDRLQEAALRNAAQLLEISEALNKPGLQDRGAELVLSATLKEIDCDLAWITLSNPVESAGPLRRFLRRHEKIALPKPSQALSKHAEARFAKSEEIAHRFDDKKPERLWIRPLVIQRPEQDRNEVVGELCVAYFDRIHRFHPGRRRTLEVITHHTEGLITQRFLRHDIEQSFSQTIQVLVQALEMHDEYTAGHSDWVSVYARLGALALGWDRRAVARAGHAGLLHDIGKVRLDSSMINHPGKLSEEQFDHFRAHPVVGAEMLKPLRAMQDILPAVCWHHERFEGGGYPSGVASSLLPPLARLMCIADSFDAMTSHRAYRRAMSHEEAVAELRRCVGMQFDPEMVEPFVVAVAGFRRLVGRWAEAVITAGKVVAPGSLLADLDSLFEHPFSAEELAIQGGDETKLIEEAALTPLDIDGLARVFCSLEEGLNDAAELFLATSQEARQDAATLASAMESDSRRSDFRIQRFIAQVWAEKSR